MDDPDEDNCIESAPPDLLISSPVDNALTCKKCRKTFATPGNLETHTRTLPKSCREAQVRLARLAATQSAPSLPAVPTKSLHLQLEDYRKSTFVPDHVPKAVRKQVAMELMEALRAVIDSNSEQAWANLLTFSYRILGQSKSSPANRRSLPATIRANLRGEVQYASTWEPTTNDPKDKATEATKDKALVKRVYRKMQEGDVSGAVRQLISEETILSPSVEVLKALQEKHPTGLPVSALTEEEATSPLAPSLTSDEMFRAVRGFPKGSAAGPDGLKPQHLKELLGAVTGVDHSTLLDLLAGVGNIMLRGKVPESARGILYGANLFAFKKKDGGIRPIAVGLTLRRLVARAVSRRLQHLQDKLVPHQLGFSVKGGMEAAIHAVRCYAELHDKADEVKAILKLDVKNAFNALGRRHLLQVVKTEIPEYLQFIHQSYGNPSFLLTGAGVILSRCGVQQGDPIGPLLFCLATHPLHKGLRAEVQVSYLDDDVLCGRPRDIIHDLDTLAERYTEAGLEFNIAKSEIFLVGGGENLKAVEKRFVRRDHPDLTWTTAEELSYLGSPLLQCGNPPKMSEMVARVGVFDKRLSLLNDHTARYLLANSLGPVRTIHLLRTSRAYDHPECLRDYDTAIESSLTRLTRNDFTPEAALQASLPVAKGGVGIRRTVELALPAFLASAHAVQNLASRMVSFDAASYAQEPVARWTEKTGCTIPESTTSAIQEAWDAPLVDTSIRELHTLHGNDLTFLPRIKAVSTADSSAWVRACPIASVGAVLDDETHRIAMALRLGLSVCTQHTCRCGQIADCFGHHALSCKRSAGRIPRHTRMNDVVSRTLHSAGFPNEVEPQGLSAVDAKRPDGHTIVPFLGPKSAAWDVTCVDTMAISYIAGSTEKAGSAAAAAEERKRGKYRDLSPNHVFLPLGFETLGPFGPQTSCFIEKMGGILKSKTHEPRATEFLKQRFSLEVQRGNAVSLQQEGQLFAALGVRLDSLHKDAPEIICHRV